MCTVFTLETKDFYVGRNLDLEYSFNEEVVITPRRYPLFFRYEGSLDEHYAMIGMATVAENYPLYAEAINEKGLSVAGLYFPGNAVYQEAKERDINLAPFEIIPYILGHYASVKELEKDLSRFNIVKQTFNEQMPLAPLHWMVADREGAMVLEPTEKGLNIYENPLGVLTNNPPFPFHLENVKHYLKTSSTNPTNTYAKEVDLAPFGQGFGMLGIPGDTTPTSRFVKTAFLKHNSSCEEDELSSVSQVFHILDNVSFVRGSTVTEAGLHDITTYSCCMNATKGMYYYTTYDNRRITAVYLRGKGMDGKELISYPLRKEQSVEYCNSVEL